MIEGQIIYTTDYCPGCNIILVYNIPIDRKIYDALNRYFFKEVRTISGYGDEEFFASYRELLPKENPKGRKTLTVIIL